MPLRLGDVAPNFSATTTEGPIDFHQWLGNSWGVLFSHPADYTPVCTTELGTVARTKNEFERRNVKVIALSVDRLESHQGWIRDINETQSCSINFPVIADENRHVATAYDMIHPNVDDSAAVRSVFVIGPDKRIKLTVTYPDSTGRNFNEILRVIDSLQLTATHRVATPADWQQGQECIIWPTLPDADAERLFPRGVRKLKPYLRYTPQPPTNPNKALWEKGDFTRIAQSMRESGETLVQTLGITPGLKVLDLGCGDGTTAIPEARLGADVLGVDIARNLVEAGNKRAREQGLTNCRFQEGDATNLHELKDQSFDLVVSIFGAMFAPKPFDVAREMVRVTRPGGRIVMGNWIPGDPTLVAQILKISSSYTPPPPEGFVSPMAWGVENNVIERFVAAGVPKENISFVKDTYTFNFPGSPSEFVAAFKRFYGPTMNAFDAAEKNGRAADLQKELEELFSRQNQSPGTDVTSIPATFLRVTVTVKRDQQPRNQVQPNGDVTAPQLNPSAILQTAFGFWHSKVLLTAVQLGVFTKLASRHLTGAELGAELQFHPRAIADFFDALVAMKFLDREGNGPQARYFNTTEGSLFLDEASPRYIGGILTMLNARLFKFWNDLPEALRTGRPQNEIKHGQKGMFEELYSDLPRLEQFMGAMTGLSRINFEAFAEKFDFSKFRTHCDVGGATGLLSIEVAKKHPHLKCTSFDLPEVEPIAKKHIAAAGLSARIGTASGDFFKDPLPKADLITMGMILHDWNLEKKMHLIRSAYDALPPGGALVAIEALIDDARRENAQGLLMSLNMLIEFGDAFDYSGADFKKWCTEVGFKRFEVIHLAGPSSAAVAYK
ncbi:MAG TPA: methyltransferase [Candidatus Limnocylindrales bacterium]|nr:methyltransferase [Candidatus Limnocylindrales bacterium]